MARLLQLQNESDELAVEAAMAPGAAAGRTLSVATLAAGLGARVAPAAAAQAAAADPDLPALRALAGYVVSFALTAVVRANELLAAAPGSGFAFRASKFDCPRDKTPSVSVAHYVERFLKYTPAPREVVIVCAAYIDRFLARNSVGVALSPFNVHRLFAVAFVLSSKWICDRYFSNKFYAKVAGLTLLELNALERVFLAEVNYALDMTPAGYDQYATPMLTLAVISGQRGDLPQFICSTVRELRAQWASQQKPQPVATTATTTATTPGQSVPSSPWGSQQQLQGAMSISASPSPSAETRVRQSPFTYSTMQL